jgi:hypothetical protein
MTDRAELLSLAVRCENEQPSQDLDECIWSNVAEEFSYETTPHYTSSLDAAVTLVPEGLGWMVRDYRDGAASALVNYPPRTAMKQTAHVASTPALALCAASLRARAEALPEPPASP